MQFRVGAEGPKPVTVILEPTGAEYVLQPGDYFLFEWENVDGMPVGQIDHTPETITVYGGPGRERMWNSDGDELPMY